MFQHESPPLSRRDLIVGAGLLLVWGWVSDADASLGEAIDPKAILQEIKRFGQMGTVLYVAAHPDDENTQLITYLSRGRGCRTAYLSLTRGDGGQNVLGGEFGAELGAIRTQELLAARRLDGGRQFFTRALDFGFSKDYRDTLETWDRQEVLADVVRVIRTFRPDVVITRFPPEPSGTHGHHTASAVLALEAFKLSGDVDAFPDQLESLALWQAKRILQNGGGPDALTVEVGGNDPVLGASFSGIAAQSRGMHKSQGFGGGSGGGGAATWRESFRLLGGEPAKVDIFDGIDTTWSRIGAGGAEVASLASDLVVHFREDDPSASVPLLLQIRARLASIPTNPLVAEKRQDIDRIIQHCVGLTFETTIPQAEIVPGEMVRLRHVVRVDSNVPVRWTSVRYPATGAHAGKNVALQRGESATQDDAPKLPTGTALSQPYWLRREATAGMFNVDDASLIGRPENPPTFPVEYTFSLGGQTLTLTGEPTTVAGRRLEVVAPVSLRPVSSVRLFAPGASKSVEVGVLAARAGMKGRLRLKVPSGWSVEPSERPFGLQAAGDKALLEFTVRAPSKAEVGTITADVEVDGARFDVERIEIRYPHIPVLLLQPPAASKAVALDCEFRGTKVGFLSGAGDGMVEALTEIGYGVVPLTGANLNEAGLRGLDAVVIGVRAFNVRTDLSDATAAALAAFAEGGGTVVVQYNRPDGLKSTKLTPFSLRLSSLRVTDEYAPVTLLAPAHPALTVPNRIVAADFDGWVQERGTYYPSEWDARFTPLLASGDPGEEPLKGGLLVAPLGRGHYVYMGLALFRQLPAGVPGAYRLLANLVSLGR